jgi:hypothetical protein
MIFQLSGSSPEDLQKTAFIFIYHACAYAVVTISTKKMTRSRRCGNPALIMRLDPLIPKHVLEADSWMSSFRMQRPSNRVAGIALYTELKQRSSNFCFGMLDVFERSFFSARRTSKRKRERERSAQ